jgi:hypothetical protein
MARWFDLRPSGLSPSRFPPTPGRDGAFDPQRTPPDATVLMQQRSHVFCTPPIISTPTLRDSRHALFTGAGDNRRCQRGSIWSFGAAARQTPAAFTLPTRLTPFSAGANNHDAGDLRRLDVVVRATAASVLDRDTSRRISRSSADITTECPASSDRARPSRKL